ncbi:MAG: hypothetical protein QOD93_7487 [Acetobacteraceae bacterium]|jgi:hypothetical protein|nr:hypothetical protein [Acetobacteraceae bacterium]
MGDVSGGTWSAFGYLYQYAATADYYLRCLIEHPTAALLIEPTALAGRGLSSDDDIVDFAVELESQVIDKVQVKGSAKPHSRPLYRGEARQVLDRLAGSSASTATLLTNRPLSPGLAEHCRRSEDGDGPIAAFAYPTAEREGGAPRRRILVDSRSIDDLASALAERIRVFRGDHALSQGESTARIVATVFLNHIFRSAAGIATTSRITAPEAMEILRRPDAEIAHATGSFDWGIPINGIPTFASTVPRVERLGEIYNAIGNPAPAQRPRVAVLSGLTGYGKSALAADFCHLHGNSYEFICWIDCRDETLVVANMRRRTEELTRVRLGHRDDPAERFLAALATHRGPWLVVFDGAAARRAIERFLPTRGNGSVLVTTTNEIGWWPGVPRIDTGVFSLTEAVSCFASYAGLGPATKHPGIERIVVRLGQMPLAVSMAGMYFGNAAGTVAELSQEYFAELDALEDEAAIPPGVDDKTAYAAIDLAVRKLGAEKGASSPLDVRMAQALLQRASLLAPDLIPLNYLIAATPESMLLQLGKFPDPEVADGASRRRYITIFRTQSIAHRNLLVNEMVADSEVAETIEIHPLVQEIVRNLFLRQIPPAALGDQLTMMMAVLIGWMSHMRNRNAFFAVDQLASHAERLLQAIVGVGRFEFHQPEQVTMFRYTRSMLQLELATCRMSRGDFTSSVNLAREVLLDLAELPRDRIRDVVALVAVSSIVVDLSTAGSSAAVLRPFAQLAARILQSCITFGGHAATAAYDRAYLLRSFLNNRPRYRSDSQLAQARQIIEQAIAHDPSDEVRQNAVMDHISELIEARDLDSAEALIPLVRDDANAHDTVTVRCLEAVVALHRGDFDSALPKLEELLGVELYETYLAVPLATGLANVYHAIQELLAVPTGPVAELAAIGERILVRGNALHDQLVASDTPPASS